MNCELAFVRLAPDRSTGDTTPKRVESVAKVTGYTTLNRVAKATGDTTTPNSVESVAKATGYTTLNRVAKATGDTTTPNSVESVAKATGYPTPNRVESVVKATGDTTTPNRVESVAKATGYTTLHRVAKANGDTTTSNHVESVAVLIPFGGLQTRVAKVNTTSGCILCNTFIINIINLKSKKYYQIQKYETSRFTINYI